MNGYVKTALAAWLCLGVMALSGCAADKREQREPIDPHGAINSIKDISLEAADYTDYGKEEDFSYYTTQFPDGTKRTVEVHYGDGCLSSVNLYDGYDDGSYRWATYTYFGASNASLVSYQSDVSGENTVEVHYDFILDADGNERLRMLSQMENGQETFLYEMTYSDELFPLFCSEQSFDAHGVLSCDTQSEYDTQGRLLHRSTRSYGDGAVAALEEETYFADETVARRFSAQGGDVENGEYQSATTVEYYESGEVRAVHNFERGISDICTTYYENGQTESSITYVYASDGSYDYEELWYVESGERDYTIRRSYDQNGVMTAETIL